MAGAYSSAYSSAYDIGAASAFKSAFSIGSNVYIWCDMLKNVASQKIGAQLVSATDGSAFTGSVTVSVTVDAGTQATGSVGAGACAHEGLGYHTYAPAQAETNGDLVAFTFTGTGAVPVTVQVYTLPTAGVATPTNITAGTITTTTNLTNLPAITANWLTAAGIATGAITSAKFAAGAIDAAAIGTAAFSNAKFAAAAIDAVVFADGAINSAKFTAGAITSTAIATDAIGAAELAASAVDKIADQVWDEVLAGHLTAGSTGAGLNAAGSAGDPWSTALPGAYGAGSAGKIIGDNINATISSRSSQVSVDDVPTNAELATSQAAADDATLAAIAALNNLSQANIRPLRMTLGTQ